MAVGRSGLSRGWQYGVFAAIIPAGRAAAISPTNALRTEVRVEKRRTGSRFPSSEDMKHGRMSHATCEVVLT
jgi:hypothetical protein